MKNSALETIPEASHFKVQIPKDYLRGPIFASCKQEKGRTVLIKKYDRMYEIGGFDPILGNAKLCPALDIRHARALFTMLTFGSNSTDEGQFKIRFSLRQFCKRYINTINSVGGKDVKVVKELLSDLLNCWFRVTYANGKKTSYRILSRVVIHSKVRTREELWLDEVELDPEFYKLLSDYTELSGIDLKALASISSTLAQAIYVYMPSRIVHRGEENPFAITLSTLLNEIGHTVPKHKSLRKQLFTQNRNSIIEQLDGVPFIRGILRIKLVETRERSDYKLLFWNGTPINKKVVTLHSKFSKLRMYWLKGNRSEEEFDKRIKKIPIILEHYQTEILNRAGVETKSSDLFIRVSIALLGESKFNEIASEVKSMVLEPSILVKNPTKLFISMVCKELAKPF